MSQETDYDNKRPVETSTFDPSSPDSPECKESGVEFENKSPSGSHASDAALLAPTKTHEDFDFDSLDSDEDSIRQMLSEGWNAEKIIRTFSHELIEREIGKRLAVILALVQRHDRPMLFIDQLCWHSGLAIANGLSLVKLAEKYGVTKQGFKQAAGRAVKDINLRKIRTERSSKAKSNMSKSYVKPQKRDLRIPFLET